ncbi:hypothetical protein Pla163_17210 [Planctomycetes bacterium Pla163]|uniref:Tetratricopeptide repeat protein n=1 Tax=Rohdeia mirabilis TaxID=2528008 RepID=A0A518CZF1_9BACT|nr:hypothetical protein Pla163_17210 [Planctomycetes bacterium Pla163]
MGGPVEGWSGSPAPHTVRGPLGLAAVVLVASLLAVQLGAREPAPGTERGGSASAAVRDERALALVAELDRAGDPAGRSAALAALLAADPDTAAAALRAPAPATSLGRRAFARFAATLGRPVAIGPLFALATDGDAAVRALALEGLGRVDLGSERLGERIERLADAARRDTDAAVRRTALEALGTLDDPAAADVLAERASTRSDEALVAATALVRLRAGISELAALVESAAAAAPSAIDDPNTLEVLIGGYGAALGRGATPPRVGARVLAGFGASANEKLATAAARALDAALAEWDRLRRPDAAEAFLDGLSDAGWSADALDHAVARRALAEDGAPPRALAAGERLERRHRFTPGVAGARETAAGLAYQAAALLVGGDPDAARGRIERAEAVLEGALRLRPDQGPRPFRREAGRAAAAADLYQRLAAVRIFDVFARVAAGTDPFDPELLERARAVHVAALNAQLVALRGDADLFVSNLEAVLARGSAPAALVDPRARGEAADHWLAVHGRTYLALAAVTGTELPGFVGTLDDGPHRVAALPARLRDPLADPERLELLQGLRIADLERVSYRVQDRLQAENRALWQRVEQSLLEKIGTDAERGFTPLLEYRDPAITALGHSSDLRGVGDSEGALAHALAVRRDLEGAPNAPTGSLSAWFNARVALAAGAAHTDLGDGAGAERELRDALTRLVALENELVQRASELEAGRIGVLQLAAIDPFQRRRLAADLARTRDLRSQVLVSLAVNANVRLRDFDAAKDWFDQAFELRQDEFMRVLRACYAARAGRVEEARFALAGVTPAPELEYNIACTLALLGDADRALVHLERALEQLPSRGARARQAEWARDDPDLAELAQDPRFDALLASFAGGG